jgi:hypothetical protein
MCLASQQLRQSGRATAPASQVPTPEELKVNKQKAIEAVALARPTSKGARQPLAGLPS